MPLRQCFARFKQVCFVLNLERPSAASDLRDAIPADVLGMMRLRADFGTQAMRSG